MIDTQLGLNWELLVGTVLCFLCAALCAGSGIGGGSFYVAIYTLLLGMDPHTAVPLSKVVIFGVAIGGCIVNMPKRHPTANRPLIDYDTVMVMEPMTLAGTVIGVYLNIVSPAYVILICLVLIVAESCYSTLKKVLQKKKKKKMINRLTCSFFLVVVVVLRTKTDTCVLQG